eukprot:Filipodium_phascolosomae@DN5805_c0_g1_i1.p1
MGSSSSKGVKPRPELADSPMKDVSSLSCGVRVIVLKGTHLPASDDSGFTDAYVVLSMVDVTASNILKYHKKILDDLSKDVTRKVPKGFQSRTSVRPCTRNPVWNEIVHFDKVEDISNCVL